MQTWEKELEAMRRELAVLADCFIWYREQGNLQAAVEIEDAYNDVVTRYNDRVLFLRAFFMQGEAVV